MLYMFVLCAVLSCSFVVFSSAAALPAPSAIDAGKAAHEKILRDLATQSVKNAFPDLDEDSDEFAVALDQAIAIMRDNLKQFTKVQHAKLTPVKERTDDQIKLLACDAAGSARDASCSMFYQAWNRAIVPGTVAVCGFIQRRLADLKDAFDGASNGADKAGRRVKAKIERAPGAANAEDTHEAGE